MNDAQGTSGNVNYMAPAVEASLYRNGKLLTRRDVDGSDDEIVGMVIDKKKLEIANARIASEKVSLHSHGFELIESPIDDPDRDYLNHQAVTTSYYPHCEKLVQQQTGASNVFAFDHNVRSAQGKRSKERIAGGQQVQGPAHMVHGDYTLTSAPQRLRDLTKPASGNDTLRAVLADGESLLDAGQVDDAIANGRFAIINVWRNIVAEPVVTHPLALCSGQSVMPDDLAVFEIHYADRIGENYFARHANAHQWFYFPALTRNEALLIKQWDSKGLLASSEGKQADAADSTLPCTFSFHTAFSDPSTPEDAPDRWSIEVRCIALY
jgi:hypothetical protein